MKLISRNRIPLPYALPILVLVVLIVVASLPCFAQMTSEGVECSQIRALGIDKQDNLRAGKIMIECGLAAAGDPSMAGPDTEEDSLEPLAFTNILVSNRSCTNSSACTKSESMVWADSANGGQTIVDNYNDHNATYSTYSGASYSTDGGATFHEIQPPPFATGHGTNYGDPIVVYNAKLGKWFAGDLVAGGDCGAQGIGLWTSTNGQTWTTGSCVHVGTSDDRESMWVDNEPTSGVYGRMYVSWGNYAVNAGALEATHSDDGVTWSTPVVLFPNTTFTNRNVQLTGSPVGAARYEGSDSTVFVAAMDEGGGAFNTRQNVIYKSLDGGNTWTSTTTGARFSPPGTLTCSGYFAVVAPIWRHMGWGQPGVGASGVVHYAYAGAGTSGDAGDIFYVRSTDNGRTWSTPVKLNTDTDNSFHTQWMPSLSADKNGNVLVSWYDRRAATSACTVATDAGCSYERVGRQSTNNGASFAAEITLSSSLIPQPTQTDPGVVSCYAGDYDYDSNLNGDAYDSWTDGRRAVSGVQVQDVNFAQTVPPGAGIINTVAGNGTYGYSGDGGAATSAELSYPTGVAVDSAGNFYLADSNNNRVRKVTAAGVISTVAGNGTGGYSGDGGAATSAEINEPLGVAVDSSGNIYIDDAYNNRIRKVTVATGIITTVAGNGTAGYSGDGGAATSAELSDPSGIALDSSGNIYIADNNNNRIRKVTKSTGIITTVAGNGTAGYSGDGGAATSAKIYGPKAVAVDSSGNIFIADSDNDRVRKVTTSGIIGTVAGNGTSGFTGDGGAATSAEITLSEGIAVDSSGNFYIADSDNYRVRKVTVSTGIINTVAGNGGFGFSGDGGPATSAELNFPWGVAIGASGNIYIGDSYNYRVRVVVP